MIGPWQREPGFRVAAKSLSQIRMSALTTRDLLRVNQPNIDVVELLENELRRNGIHFHIVDPEVIPGEAARAVPDEGVILVTSESYESICDEDPDFQLLVPHEIAHIVLRHAATFARATSAYVHTSMEDSEVQADRFSHEFVMPIALVQKHCQSIGDMQRVFNVSVREAQIRRDQLLREQVINW